MHGIRSINLTNIFPIPRLCGSILGCIDSSALPVDNKFVEGLRGGGMHGGRKCQLLRYFRAETPETRWESQANRIIRFLEVRVDKQNFISPKGLRCH